MSEMNAMSFDRLLEILAEKLVAKLIREPNRLYPRLLTIEQAAVYLGCPVEALQEWISCCKLAVVRAGRRVFLDRVDLDKWIDEHKTGWV
jgi:excisionase family DNA binding protein